MTATPHILVVDDHREIRELVSRALVRPFASADTA
jgi:CheY-like chemotaxis protein